MDACDIFGAEIFALRQQRSWSQARLAHAANISRAYVSELENGRVPPPRARTFERLVAVLTDTEDQRNRIRLLAQICQCQWACSQALPPHLRKLTGYLLGNAERISPHKVTQIVSLIEELAM